MIIICFVTDRNFGRFQFDFEDFERPVSIRFRNDPLLPCKAKPSCPRNPKK